MTAFVEIVTETDPIREAAAVLRRVHATLAHRHGDAFRALERRIDALADSDGEPTVHWLPVARGERVTLLVAPPQEWVAILAEAKRLGVI